MLLGLAVVGGGEGQNGLHWETKTKGFSVYLSKNSLHSDIYLAEEEKVELDQEQNYSKTWTNLNLLVNMLEFTQAFSVVRKMYQSTEPMWDGIQLID